jgi:hypothetical protein
MSARCEKCGGPAEVERRGHFETIRCKKCGVLFEGTVSYPLSAEFFEPPPSLEIRKGDGITVPSARSALNTLSAGFLQDLGVVQASRLLTDGAWIRLPTERGTNLDELAEQARRLGFDVRRATVQQAIAPDGRSPTAPARR